MTYSAPLLWKGAVVERGVWWEAMGVAHIQ